MDSEPKFVVSTQSFVNILIVTDINEFGSEKRFPKDITIYNLKNKLELITGYTSIDMKLNLLNKDKTLICEMADDEKMLGFYPIEDGHVLQVKSTQGNKPTFAEDDPNFTRFELTDEEYAKKKGTIKEFLANRKIGQYAEKNIELQKAKEAALKEKLAQEQAAVEKIPVGSRCQVLVENAPTRLGTVMFKGQIANKPGHFVGIKYDEPLGKNDGSIGGERYFQCNPNYGGFVKPESVIVGDFPEEDFDEI